MSKRFLGKLAFPPPDPEFNTVEQSVYVDDVTHELVITNEKTNQELYRIGGGGTLPNNPFDFYVDGNVAVSGDGSIESPFKTLTELNNKILSFPANVDQYVGYLAPFPAGYGSEVVGSLNIAENLNLRGIIANMTIINCDINLTSTGLGSGATILQYRGIAFNGIVTINLALSTFGFVTITDGQISINRTDSNASATILLNGGVFGTTISGGVVVLINALIFSPIIVQSGATLYATNTMLFTGAGTFRIFGTAILKTLSTLNPSALYVDGVVVGLDTPVWLTDASSDEAFGGAVTKTVY